MSALQQHTSFSRLLRGWLFALLWMSVLLVPLVAAQAQFALPKAPEGIPQEALPVLIARIIRNVLTIVAVLAVGFIVYGGFRYIMSRGDDKEVQAAKNTIVYAVMGLVIIGLSFAIVQFVFNVLLDQA